MLQPSRTPRRTNLKRTAILGAGMQAFGEHGFDGANLDAISEEAKVSKRTVYKQFGSKEGLFQAVVEQLLERLSALRPDKPLSDEPVTDQLLAFARSKVAAMALDPSWNALMRIVLGAIVQNPAAAREMLNALQREDAWLTAWFRAADTEGRLSVPDPERTSRLFWAAIWGAVLWPRAIGVALDDREEDETIQEIVHLFMGRHALGL
jgi:TetR/AcrR family transcriptional regulator, regulator of autoinduction and epiphytic fitness